MIVGIRYYGGDAVVIYERNSRISTKRGRLRDARFIRWSKRGVKETPPPRKGMRVYIYIYIHSVVKKGNA